MTAQKVEFAKFKTAPVIFISGGASSLAYFVTKLLFSAYKQIKIISVDNLETGTEENIAEFKNDPRYSFIKYDLNKGVPENMPAVDCILHLAAVQTHSQEEDSITLDSLLTNAFATKNLLELARANNAKFLLASSINVYQGILSSLNLKNYFGPTSQIEKKFSHIEAKRYAEALCWEYYKKYDLDLRIVRLGELFGPKIPLFGQLGTILRQVIEEGLINIAGDGLEKEIYVYVEDAAEAIARALLVKNTKGKIFPVSYEKPISVIELAYLAKAIVSKDVKISFFKEDSLLEIPAVKNIARDNLDIIAWKPKTDLEDGIKKTFEFYKFLDVKGGKLFTLNLNEKVLDKKRFPTLSAVIKRDKGFALKPPSFKLPRLPSFGKITFLTKKNVLAGIFFTLALLILPSIFYILNLYFSAVTMLKATNSLQTYNIVKAETYASRASKHYNLSQNPPLLITTASNVFGKKDFLVSLKHFSKALYYSSRALLSFSKTAQLSGDFEKLLAGISKTEEFLMLSKAEYANVDSSFYIFNINKSTLDSFAGEYLTRISHFKVLIPHLPKILGFEKPVTYVVLIQNSTEITPAGGVLSSVAKIDLENGKVTDIVVDNAVASDVVNFPDFPESAKAFATFYKESFKEDLDGVFAVDLEFIKSLLDLTGPLFLSYYDVTVTKDNIYEKAQFYTEYGASYDAQKKNFLSNVIYKISDALFTSKDSSVAYGFLNVLEKVFNEKHLLAYFMDSSTRNVFYELNWCGDMAVYSADYIYALDTNVGATRANLDVTKSIDYSVQRVSENLYKSHIKLVFKHTGKSNAWPSGVYKNLFRLYVPQGSVLVKAVYTNKVGVDVTKDVKVENYKAFTVFPLLIQVGAGETASVEFEYTLPTISKYNLVVQKQPGEKDVPFVFSLFDEKGNEIAKEVESLKTDIKIDISPNFP
ncbi:MAG: NAD-dependent epimerase/dehydratase family protein [Patescibacteria group bacterium]